jgi:hypothetical protein
MCLAIVVERLLATNANEVECPSLRHIESYSSMVHWFRISRSSLPPA